MTIEAGHVWKQTGYFVVPNSARAVMNALGAIGTYSTGQRFAWRGMSSADYPCVSSLQRDIGGSATESALRNSELSLLQQAREWGLGVSRLGLIDDLQLLADLQHFGVPTRLIDFTSNPMTALWFACQQPSVEGVAKSGVLVALNVSGWSSVKSGDKPLMLKNTDEPWANTLESCLMDGQPFLVGAVEPNARLAAQEGFFAAGVVPGANAEASPFKSFEVPFDPVNPGDLDLAGARGRGAPRKLPFVAVIIRSHLKSKLLSYLDATYNRTARVLFPDFPGFREFATATGSREPSAAIATIPGSGP